MAKGISVYFGEQTLSEMIKYIEIANDLKYKCVFTSLHLPEVDFKPLLTDFKKLGTFCHKLNMLLMVDISPKTFSYFSYNEFLNYMDKSKLSLLRIDFGLSIELIIKLSNSNRNFKIVLNASTILPETFDDLINKGLNLENIEVCHNFYPRPETGISEEFFTEQTNYFKSRGLKVSAFIPAGTGKRAPVFEGLPTIEDHRKIKSSLAYRHLKLLGTDNIYFGDNKISKDELKNISILDDESTAIECEILSDNPGIVQLFKQIHTDRPDSSDRVIRSQESRLTLSTGSFNKVIIEPENTVERKTGYITIDNKLYNRYAGELQICRIPLDEDSRVNVIGRVLESNLFLLPYIIKAKKYYFSEKLEF